MTASPPTLRATPTRGAAPRSRRATPVSESARSIVVSLPPGVAKTPRTCAISQPDRIAEPPARADARSFRRSLSRSCRPIGSRGRGLECRGVGADDRGRGGGAPKGAVPRRAARIATPTAGPARRAVPIGASVLRNLFGLRKGASLRRLRNARALRFARDSGRVPTRSPRAGAQRGVPAASPARQPSQGASARSPHDHEA